MCRHATFVVVRGRCYRSQKKSGRPYGVTATFSEDGSVWASSCECAAKEGLCNHALALLRLVVLLKKQGYEEPPPEVACTELPQQWRRPRGPQIPATSVAEVDWRAVRDGGSSKPRGSRLYDARKRPRDLSEMQDAIHRLGSDLCALGDSPFAKHLRTVQILGTESKFGMVPVGSPLSYQQPTSPHGFATYTSPNIALRSRDLSNSSPCWPVLFSSASTYEPATQSLSDAETSLLQVILLFRILNLHMSTYRVFHSRPASDALWVCRHLCVRTSRVAAVVPAALCSGCWCFRQPCGFSHA